MSSSAPPPEPPREPPQDPDPAGRRRRYSLTTALVLEDFRSVRRWLIVLGLLAVMAAGVAAFALVKAYEAEDQAADQERVAALERSLERRLDELQAALRRAGDKEDIARLQREVRRKGDASDLTRLDRRLNNLDDDVTTALDDSADTARALSRLNRRVAQLSEEQQQQQ